MCQAWWQANEAEREAMQRQRRDEADKTAAEAAKKIAEADQQRQEQADIEAAKKRAEAEAAKQQAEAKRRAAAEEAGQRQAKEDAPRDLNAEVEAAKKKSEAVAERQSAETTLKQQQRKQQKANAEAEEAMQLIAKAKWQGHKHAIAERIDAEHRARAKAEQ